MSTTLSDRITTKRKQYVRILLLQCLLIGLLPLMPPQRGQAVAQVPISTQPSLSNHPLVDDAFLVHDIRQTSNSYPNDYLIPGGFFATETTLFFWADDSIHGFELWATDGDTNTTRMVKDINPGRRSSHNYNGYETWASLNNKIFFTASDGTVAGLWMSDGTNSGTRLVKAFTSLALTDVKANGAIVFAASDNTYGSELWRSDGTPQGTYRLRDIAPGFDSSSPSNFIQVNTQIFFTATTPASGTELWVTDGTPNNTHLVRDLRPGSSSSAEFYYFSGYPFGNTLLFTANDGRSGRELWKTDGTPNGTSLVKNITSGGDSTTFGDASVVMNNIVYFIADDGSTGAELWRSDGTAGGTFLVRDINSSSDDSVYTSQELVVLNNALYFAASTENFGRELWKSDGTAQGTMLVMDIVSGSGGSYPEALIMLNNQILFVSSGSGLWQTDGTAQGTTKLKTLSFPGGKGPQAELFVFNNAFYMVANDGIFGYEIWHSDGTAVGTTLLKDIRLSNGSKLQNLSAVTSKVFFYAEGDGDSGQEIWVSNGTSSGTLLPRDTWPINNNIRSYYPFITVNEQAFFMGNDGTNGPELWASDGSTNGTRLIRDIYSGQYGSYPDELTKFNNNVVFIADDSITGKEPWISNGTSSGTMLLRDINPTSSSFSYASFTQVNTIMFFVYGSWEQGYDLWKTDGTPAGTVMVRDMNVGSISNLIDFNGFLFFITQQGIWRSDGTANGTTLVAPASWTSAGNFTVVGDKLFFMADTPTYGLELWVTNGTAGGTHIVSDIYPGTQSALDFEWQSTDQLVSVNGLLFFAARHPDSGVELWMSDGTDAGTSLVADIYPGAISSLPSDFLAVDGHVVFSANDGTHGYEVWISDGSRLGTMLLQDINPGSSHADPHDLVQDTSFIYFAADDGTHGEELWAFPKNQLDSYIGELTTPGSYFSPNQSTLLVASIRKASHTLPGLSNVNVRLSTGQTLSLFDNGSNGDDRANDGVYTRILTLPEVASLDVHLYIGDIRLNQISLIRATRPLLLLISDWSELFNEFSDTGMDSVTDENQNQIHDYYEAIKRIHQYTNRYQGLIFDPSLEITLIGGYSTNYDLLDYGANTAARWQKGVLIDTMITQVTTEYPAIQNVAIVGDDQVVPFYRVFDPLDYLPMYTNNVNGSIERSYGDVIGGIASNATLEDVTRAYIMSDVPYSIRQTQVITPGTWYPSLPQNYNPMPNMGIGRIFADHPHELISMIERYEQPLFATPEQASVALFAGRDTTMSSPLNAMTIYQLMIRSVWNNITNRFGTEIAIHDAEQGEWQHADTFIDSLGNNGLTLLWGHSSHEGFSINGNSANSTILAADIKTAIISQSVALVGLGCHLGLSVSDFPDTPGKGRHYERTLVKSLLRQGVATFAPTSQAYTFGKAYAGHVNPSNSPFGPAGGHELITALFNNHLIEGSNRTVGDVWKRIFPAYHATDPGTNINGHPGLTLYHLTGAYGVAFYGLPTQVIAGSTPSISFLPATLVDPQIQQAPIQRVGFTSSVLTATVAIDSFDIKSQPDGTTLFSVPFGGHVVIPNGPALPMVTRSFMIPAHLTVLDVRLTNVSSHIYEAPVTLSTIPVQSTNTEVITGTFALPIQYPDVLFDYTLTNQLGGTLLTIKTIPFQYDATSRHVTLYDRLDFAVDGVFSLPSGAQITNIAINNQQPVVANQSAIPVLVNISSTVVDNVTLQWEINTESGFLEHSSRALLSLVPGTTQTQFTLDTRGWEPGMKDVVVSVLQNNVVVSSVNIPVKVEGVGLYEPAEAVRIYESTVPTATWTVFARNEQGVILSGLQQFELTIDQQTTAMSITEAISGYYTLQMPLTTLSTGAHTARITVADGRGMQDTYTRGFVIQSNRVYLPLITRILPDTPTPTPTPTIPPATATIVVPSSTPTAVPTVIPTSTVPAEMVPAAPTALRATSTDSLSIVLVWEDQAWNESGFEIYDGNTLLALVAANSSTYTVNSLMASSYHCFNVRAVNAVGGSMFAQVCGVAPPLWTVQFWNTMTMEGAPVATQSSDFINFYWQSGAPHPSISDDYFSTRISRNSYFAEGRYQFTFYHDDGIRVFIDGVQHLDRWYRGSEASIVEIPLAAGNHTVLIEHVEIDGWSRIGVAWTLLGSEDCRRATNGVTMYSNGNYQGQCYNFSTDYHDLNLINFNDLASSIEFRGSYQNTYDAVLYQHNYYAAFGGTTEVITQSKPTLTLLNNETTSLQVRRSVDSFEPDNTCGQASLIRAPGVRQSYTAPPGDTADWIRLEVSPGATYILQTQNLSPLADTVIDLYRTDCVTLIATDDDSGDGKASRIQWTADTNLVYLRISQWANRTERGRFYDFEMIRP